MSAIHHLKRPRSLTEQAADAIRARIVSGVFPLGEALSEITLAAELGVSKTPVREAFLQLKNEGLVDIQPQRGTFVFQMSAEQIRQLAVFRELLELQALQLAIRENSALLADNLNGIVLRMTEAIDAADYRVYREFDNNFHLQIIALSNNQFIAAAYHSIAFRIHALRNRLSFQQPADICTLEDHRELAQLICANRAADAEAKLADHIRGSVREYIQNTDGNAAPTP